MTVGSIDSANPFPVHNRITSPFTKYTASSKSGCDTLRYLCKNEMKKKIIKAVFKNFLPDNFALH